MDNALNFFLKTARQYPEVHALVTSEQHITYRELSLLALSYANVFTYYHAKTVLILVPQGAHAFAAMFGAWMAGAQYCPVNTGIPEIKIHNIARTYRPDLIIHEAGISSELLQQINTTAIATDKVEICTEEAFNTISSPQCSAVAYTIFTSGSTGAPKGVQIQHRALTHYLHWVKRAFPIKPGLRWSQHPNIGFDLSVLDIFGALCFGATLYPLISNFDRMFPARFIKRHALQLWNSTPSVVDLMSEAGDCTTENLQTLEMFNFCGEPLKRQTLDAIFSARPDISVQNTYGPTEATVSCTDIVLTRNNYQNYCRHSACLGRMIDGMHYILDSDSASAQTGELLLYGEQLSCGYLNRADLNASKFISIKIDNQEVICYRTGDMVELHEGLLYFLARADDIVKISGKLVDLNAVEYCIRTKLTLNCHLVHDSGKLYLFVKSGSNLDLQELRRTLSEFLEPHEMPSVCKEVRSFPYSSNDKVDKRKLLALV